MDTNNMRAHASHTKTGPPGHTPNLIQETSEKL